MARSQMLCNYYTLLKLYKPIVCDKLFVNDLARDLSARFHNITNLALPVVPAAHAGQHNNGGVSNQQLVLSAELVIGRFRGLFGK